MLRRISIALAGLLAVGFLAASPAAAQPGDVHGCWFSGGPVAAGSVFVADFHSTCWHVG
ncbi:hypothetical protein I3F58_26215 [Streptomyces sp. MUM 203J]|uniref:hypothetical protein n=1 Tax=Streptomyces sp. MUM 203J TaxID=2791990 RepID=UPI001F03E63A|nr:hypothetical protein [Streptomyces sp. MUM 203J]MCH0542988.1 hypothetical protein [Streptomyces sp. MUM 203J]